MTLCLVFIFILCRRLAPHVRYPYQEHQKSEEVDTFVQMLIGVTKYEMFVELMHFASKGELEPIG